MLLLKSVRRTLRSSTELGGVLRSRTSGIYYNRLTFDYLLQSIMEEKVSTEPLNMARQIDLCENDIDNYEYLLRGYTTNSSRLAIEQEEQKVFLDELETINTSGENSNFKSIKNIVSLIRDQSLRLLDKIEIQEYNDEDNANF